MHQDVHIEFENIDFFSFWGKTAPSDIPFFPLQWLKIFLAKASTQENVGGNRYNNNQYFIIKSNVFLVKFAKRYAPNRAN